MDPTPDTQGAAESLEDAIERLRHTDADAFPLPRLKTPPPRLPHQRVWAALAVAVVLVGIWGAFDVAHRASAEGDYAALGQRSQPVTSAKQAPGTSTSSTTVPTTGPPPAVAAPPETTATTTPPATSPPTTTPPTTTPPTTRPPTTTTTLATAKPVKASSAVAVNSGVQLKLSAAPPASGEPRIAAFRLEAEFGDVRVLRSVRLEFGDGASQDSSVVQWACLDPAAPNPYVLDGPSHAYSAPGTYSVTATVRTAPCSVPDGAELAEETAQVRLTLVVS